MKNRDDLLKFLRWLNRFENKSEDDLNIIIDAYQHFENEQNLRKLEEETRYHTLMARSTLYPGKTFDEVAKILDDMKNNRNKNIL